MANQIYYVGYFDTKENEEEKRGYVLAATNKMAYIASAIRDTGREVEILSASNTQLSRYFKKKEVALSEGIRLKLFSTFCGPTCLHRVLGRTFIRIQLFTKLLMLPKESKVIVYHSLGYQKTISFVRKMKRLHMIIEVEELYGDVMENDKITSKEEKFFKIADGYIFPTQLLDEKINTDHKSSVIIHGTYQVEPEQICRNEYCKMHGWDESRIHVVYAGTLDPRKGGAVAAAAAAEFLSDKYHLHILGFGSSREISNMKELIAKISEKTACRITYDGLLAGDEYLQFIQSCDIGLSTQNPDAAFNSTSFPSKILSYMSNGLRVVSIRIQAIQESSIGPYMYYYDCQTPEEIAQAIMKVNFSDSYDSREVIRKLDRRFRQDIYKLLRDSR